MSTPNPKQQPLLAHAIRTSLPLCWQQGEYEAWEHRLRNSSLPVYLRRISVYLPCLGRELELFLPLHAVFQTERGYKYLVIRRLHISNPIPEGPFHTPHTTLNWPIFSH